ncbi:Thioredoxin reductase [Rhizobium sp. RU33A]|uniref:NAD(P)/FAD-dependent oxidoreductase n=1 Tax=Rhizobium sp. RU33A TaxID=1907413 RepID=UPI000955331E|nr:NAD(P)/FAD-dependent oxidoreductase [Rhizobium sp. RU33A]SIQ86497.1 Thioredoxin reductase [Rhizobium sp. RU33A]
MQYDTIIVGGSFAGLTAARYLARARRHVCVLDLGDPRHRFSAQPTGMWRRDDDNPHSVLQSLWDEVATYPTVTLLAEAAVKVQAQQEDFVVTNWSGEHIAGRRLLLAFGVSDNLPDIPGLAERWGVSVLPCPDFHGFNYDRKPVGVLNASPRSPEQAMLLSEWCPTTLYLDGSGCDASMREALERRKIRIEAAPVRRLAGDGCNLARIYLADNQVQPLDTLFLTACHQLNSSIAEELGCAIETGPLGQTIAVNGQHMTSIRHVYAAGDICRKTANMTLACADGMTAAMAIHHSLVFETNATEFA